ncbi:MAG: carboxymuconolactone decarboxylase family protein [Bryobacterales bacterium]|nr:carboxymuconolactone decarboxylase family protein [Bryobacterales bacterium]
MPVENLAELIPDYAKDLRLNLTSLLRQTELNESQFWGTVVACAMACRNGILIEELLPEAATHLSPEAFQGAKASAAVMGMNNIFFRFGHLSSNEKYKDMPSRLRMNAIRTHGADPVDFELWCLAASAINGCGTCVDSHERVLREKGLTEETVLAAVRVASILHGIATVLETESYVESA